LVSPGSRETGEVPAAPKNKVRFLRLMSQLGAAAVRSYSQILKPGMKRKAVEDYLRFNETEFLRLSLDDITKIGEDEPMRFCPLKCT
jgi:hypothetical protein